VKYDITKDTGNGTSSSLPQQLQNLLKDKRYVLRCMCHFLYTTEKKKVNNNNGFWPTMSRDY